MLVNGQSRTRRQHMHALSATGLRQQAPPSWSETFALDPDDDTTLLQWRQSSMRINVSASFHLVNYHSPGYQNFIFSSVLYRMSRKSNNTKPENRVHLFPHRNDKTKIHNRTPSKRRLLSITSHNRTDSRRRRWDSLEDFEAVQNNPYM